MSLAGRKHAAIGAKLAQMRDELEQWRGLTEKDGLPLARHWSQVQAVSLSLDHALDELEAALGSVRGSDAEVVEGCVELQSKLLDVHRAWEYFRSKLAQRFVTQLAPFLLATDELAWECYRPAPEAALAGGADAAAMREPPLTFLNGGASPFLLARGESFAAAIGDGGVRNERLRMLVEILPVPIIGLPWHHLGHLPDAVVVAHEAGHAVEDDLGLAGAVRERIGGAITDEEHAPAWRAWGSEVFADVYATLALGPAYAGALAEFVAGGRRAVVTARPTSAAWGAYPTPTLRVLLSAEVCRRAGCTAAADELVGDWRRAYPDHALGGWEPDTVAIAAALIDAPFDELGGRTLDRTIRFDVTDWTTAANDAARMLRGSPLVGTGVRQLVATAGEAFARAPDVYAGDDCGDAILARVGAYSDGSRRRGRCAHPRFAARTRAVDDGVRAVLAGRATTISTGGS